MFGTLISLLLALTPSSGAHPRGPATPQPTTEDLEATSPSHDTPEVSEERPPGLLPPRTHGGSLAERSFLTGDWHGARDRWTESGVRVDIALTQTLQSVLDGGVEETTEYGGRLDSRFTFDLDRMGAIEGALLNVRAESRYGDSVNRASGALLPVNDVMFFPLGEPDEDILINVTEFRYTQFLSPKVAVFLGKLVILGGDVNEFAGGRGDTQFMSHSFVSATVTSLVNPYSSLGAGVTWALSKSSNFTSALYGSQDASSTAGFDELADGLTWNTAFRTQYELGALPGGYNVAFQYAFDGSFIDLSGQFVGPPGQFRPARDGDSWNAYANFWQYISVEGGSQAPVDVTNERIDREGWGLFGRCGIADRDTNPVEWAVSGGVSGRGMIDGRDDDTFGVGLATSRLVADRLTNSELIDRSPGRLEVFYAYSFTPAAILTFDFQLANPLIEGLDTATLFGLRLRAAL